MFKLGIDLGGTKIEGVVLDENNDQLLRERVATEQEGGYRHILANLQALYDLMASEIKGRPHTLGIGTPGAISPRSGLLRNSNTLCLNDQPLKEDLETLLGRKIAIENDANCFAMAEATGGAGTGCDLVFGVIMGTGCGGGIVYRGKVLAGPQAIAGEWGHSSIDPNGPACWCGRRGCIERFISGGGLRERYLEQFGESKSTEAILADFRNGQERAIAFMQAFWTNFGRAMSNLINLLDPDVVVLGGGLSNIEELYQAGVAEVEKRIFGDYFSTPIVKNQLGDSAGVLGAAFVGC